jgi:hypothetical protein
MQALILGQAQAPVHNFAANDAALHETSAYKAQPLLAISTGELYNCPLLWWHDRRHLFPRLFQLMKRFLCIPATSASSERVFSLAGITIANDRAAMLPENAAESVLLKCALQMEEFQEFFRDPFGQQV